MKFYQDPVYIEMCRKAEEIQARFSFTDGDYLIDGDDDAQCWSGYDVSDFPGLPMKQVWLPRLDQLIRIATDQNIPSAPDPLWPDSRINRFAYWSGYVGHGLHEDPAATLERLTLRYIMDIKYGKRWTGSEWVKI